MKKLFTLFALLMTIVIGAKAAAVTDLKTISADKTIIFEDYLTANVAANTLIAGDFLFCPDGNNYKTDQGSDADKHKYCCRVKSATQDKIAFKVSGACTLVLNGSRVTDRAPHLNTNVSDAEATRIAGTATAGESGKKWGTVTFEITAAGTYYIIGNGSDHYLSALVFTFPAATVAPSKPTLTVEGGDVNGGSTTTIASANASKIYYCWTNSATAPEKTAENTWTEATGASYEYTIPNVAATGMYLHAYGYNTVGTSDIKTSNAFNVTKVKEAAGLAYATAALTKDITDASFTNTLTNPHNLAVTYSIAEGATATGVQVDENGLVTIGSVTGTATIKATYDGDDTYEAGEASYVLTVVNANRTATNNAYYVAVNDQFIPGATITGEDIVMTFDANSGAGFSKAVADNTLGFLNSNYVASMAGNNNTANGWKASFEPTKAGILSVGVVINNNKTFSITPDDNVASFTYNGVNAAEPAERVSAVVTGNTLKTGSDTSAKLYVLVTISVEANKKYEFSVAGSKMGFYGFEFKESGSTETVTTPAEGVATFVTPYALDFTGLATKAYIVTAVSNTSASTQAVTTVPAGTPLLVKGASVEVPIIASADAVEGNLLKVATAGGKVGAAGIYAYSKSAKQFRPVATTVTIPAGKCYLEISGNSGDAIDIDFDDAPTAVEAVQEVQEFNGSKVQKVIKNGQLFIGNYTVAGARVK